MFNYKKYAKLAIPFVLAYSTNIHANQEDWKEKLKQKTQQFKQGLENKVVEGKSSFQQYKQQTGENLSNSYQNFKNSELGAVVNKSVREVLSNPSKLYEINSAMKSSAINTTIGLVKNYQIYDPNDGQLKTVDTLLKESLESTGLRLPPEISNDPVKAAFLLSMDKGYLLNANLIKDGNDWVSLNDLRGKKSLPEIEDALLQYSSMATGLRSQNYHMFETSTRNFLSDIDKINKSNNAVKFPWSGTPLAFMEENPIYRSVDSIYAHFVPREKGIFGKDYPISEDTREKLNWTIIGLLGLGGAVAVSKIGKKIKQGKKPQPSPVIYKQGTPKRTLRY